jgi:hypothetical protein
LLPLLALNLPPLGKESGFVSPRYNDDPGLSVTGYGRGNNQLLGEFTVYDVAYDTGSGVQRFAPSRLMRR